MFRKQLVGGALLGLVAMAGMPFGSSADTHYFSLKQVFPEGKCSPVVPYFEVMHAGFSGGEVIQYKIHDADGKLVETITSFVSKNRDQWAMVGSKTESKVIFCLYASGIGGNSVTTLPDSTRQHITD